MVRFTQVTKHYGTHDVLVDVTAEILPDRKIGLIGANGAGKTTLVRLLTGAEEPSSGSITVRRGLRIGFVPQHVEVPPRLTAREFVLEDHLRLSAALRAEEEALTECRPEDQAKALTSYQRARDAFDASGGEAAPRKAEDLLGRLGLSGVMDRAVGTLSGGEKNVLSLAKALSGGTDLLVLDEPGNHLDYIGLSWLERFLDGYRGALLIVSHNRYLLDRVVDRVWELERGSITEYEGNYSRYRLTRLRNAVAQQADYAANQKRLAQLEALVARFAQIARNRPDPAWGRRLHARKTQLEREKRQAVEKPVLQTARITLASQAEETKADIALQVRGYSKAFGDRALFDGAELSIWCGERVALIGPNGSGKTTLIKDIVNPGNWGQPGRGGGSAFEVSSMIRIGPSMKVGYCAQNQEIFDPERTILEEFLQLGQLTRKEVFTALSRFLFTWEDLDARIGSLSGGEKNRLQLARAMMTRANFLILDEPTNHMDIPSRETIEESLASFPGTILVVSHDRYFLDKVATAIIEIREGKLVKFNGTFSELWARRGGFLSHGDGGLLSRRKRYEEAGRGERARGAGRPAENLQHAANPRPAVANLERRIMELEAKKREVESAVTAAFMKGDHQLGRRLASTLERVSRMLDDAYVQWGEAAD